MKTPNFIAFFETVSTYIEPSELELVVARARAKFERLTDSEATHVVIPAGLYFPVQSETVGGLPILEDFSVAVEPKYARVGVGTLVD